jgi:hypothetical protein
MSLHNTVIANYAHFGCGVHFFDQNCKIVKTIVLGTLLYGFLNSFSCVTKNGWLTAKLFT